MNNLPNNSGIVNFGGTNDISNNNLGSGTQVNNHGVSPSSPLSAVDTRPVEEKPQSWDVGVVTFLSKEMRAVTEQLGLRSREKIDGLFFSTGKVTTDAGTVSVVATQTHSPGQRSVMSALDHLRRHFSPRLWILVGIGGGLHPEYARIGNVIVSTRIVYYDSRKIRGEGDAQRRGEERQAPARIVHAVNVYFTDRGEPAMIRGQADGHRKRTFEVHPGLIGSGEAVIADGDSDVHRFLEGYNDKVLAVDMESGGLSQYWQENSVGEEPNPDWVVVRGISDNADQEKNDDGHDLAAHNAAHVVKELLPYLC
ncbi:5'-methylthioadenosine/S-adenosylhomocysteine nucleosidase [Nocardiopsis sp. L17-MgMaSL7]|uniref:5'-methylthioadenosine/S-adenosylhomocysteine nucleosidase family protein n=1 Tax=Nocardiopsis sp. L17-MgMaSL7 TaxID=1938893 RepID=UPI000D7138CA|nr:5'-methylthioadenosine/S-adenosylhomocysteine nucleosidase [Nocardiopsis sp. L17-MgMaSL7]PWV47364.1 adenosylhomocysteine nucleosidase [Nocardiopsis sp. L17-MgMaSL7]